MRVLAQPAHPGLAARLLDSHFLFITFITQQRETNISVSNSDKSDGLQTFTLKKETKTSNCVYILKSEPENIKTIRNWSKVLQQRNTSEIIRRSGINQSELREQTLVNIRLEPRSYLTS